MTILVVILMIVLLACGVPAFAALGGVAAVFMIIEGEPPIAIAQTVADRLNSGSLIAIPFFILAAGFMERGGVVRVLVRAAEAWLGSARGGLALVCVAATTVFAAVSGSSVATAVAMGAALVPAMLARGYPRPFALGVIGGSGTLGILIPPSLMLIIYGIIAEVSVPRLFLAGVIPGLLQAILFAGYVVFAARSKNLPVAEPLPREEALKAMWHALPAMSIPAVVFVGIYGGFTTVAEAAALAALLSLLVGKFAYRGYGWRALPELTLKGMRHSSAIILIVAGAILFAHWLTLSQMPQQVLAQVLEADLTSLQFLLVINIVMLLLGMILEGVSILLIAVPLLLPALLDLGVDPVHYAIIVVINIELAMLTPPVGLNLFVLSGISRAPVGEVARGALPFVFLLVLLLAIVTLVPGLTTFLPNLVLGE